MKKILFLIPTLGGGGAERVLVNLVNNLDKSKYDITVKTLFKSNVNSKYLKSDVKYIEGKVKQFKGNTYVLKLFSPKILYKFFVKQKYDIVVSYLEGPTARIAAGCTDKQIKLVSWIHVEQKNQKALAHSFRSVKEANRCYKKYHTTVCVSDTVKQDFLSLCDVDSHCVVLYNTNEDEKIQNLALRDISKNEKMSAGVNVISIGRLCEQKGYDRLIKVHKRLLDAGLMHNIYIFGSGSDEAALKQLADSYGVSQTFHFMGFSDNPYKYIKHADLFVCSSRREGFSTAVTESLIIGTPVVSTCCSGAYELLGNNNEYGIVTENSEEGIYEGMFKMLSDENALKYYKHKAQERGKYFSKENTVKAVEDMFDSLLNEV